MAKNLTTEEFKKRMAIEAPNISLVSDYKNWHTLITLRCEKCGAIFIRAPRHKPDYVCPNCLENKDEPKHRTTDDFKEMLKNIDNSILVTSEYISSDKPINCQCLKCGRIWTSTPNRLLQGKGCNVCKRKGKYPKRLRAIFTLMKQRCYNSKAPNYKQYGGRGIEICEEWLQNPYKFFDWALQNGYADDLTIDRINVNKNYCPKNCRWITKTQQTYNKTNSLFVTYNGETKNFTEWCNILGIDKIKARNDYKRIKDFNEIVRRQKPKS